VVCPADHNLLSLTSHGTYDFGIVTPKRWTDCRGRFLATSAANVIIGSEPADLQRDNQAP
jgi:hypothetical protein